MQIQKIGNQILTNNHLNHKKSNLNFSGKLYMLESETGNIAPRFANDGMALNEFRDLVKTFTNEGLNVFISKMPEDEAKLLNANPSTARPDGKLANIKIEYHDIDKGSKVVSGHYLNPWMKSEESLCYLAMNLMENAKNSISAFMKEELSFRFSPSHTKLLNWFYKNL